MMWSTRIISDHCYALHLPADNPVTRLENMTGIVWFVAVISIHRFSSNFLASSTGDEDAIFPKMTMTVKTAGTIASIFQ